MFSQGDDKAMKDNDEPELCERPGSGELIREKWKADVLCESTVA